ncbi:pyridoxal-phosphate dependent enzyme [Sporomusa acidovorans]|uniref:pyridoxal-phosphate dependent enzyme n=1 Tax=Sporomusa acidovorans TaxID=112900 RepID=UPI002481BDF1|nr:pyridoxal-phosphate dependent enzyme [Sporomusa acidovorans]
MDEKEAKGEKVLNIPIGGQGVIGAAGYIQAVPEIMRQMKAQDIDAKFLVVSYGSTGTFAGLWAGAMHYKVPFKVIGIPVLTNYPSREDTANFINEISQTYEMSFRASPDDVEIVPGPVDNRYFGVEYNVPDSSTWEYIQLLARTEAIFLDPCYTGKGFHGFVDMVRSGVIPAEEGAIFINTGGTPGLWTKEHLDFAQSVLWTSEDKITVFKAEL